MSTFLSSSIGKKLIMSVTGLFLIVFLAVHLTANLFLLVSAEAYNIASHFMETNPIIQIMQPVLAAGFIFHIIYATILTIRNQKSRPIRYDVVDQSESSTWASRNMYVLGGLVLVFIFLHLVHFFGPLKFGEVPEVVVNGTPMHDSYLLVSTLFEIWYYAAIYVVGALLLAFHLSHGFWSAFQTIGWNNKIWKRRFSVFGYILAAVYGFGFACIPLYFLLTN